MCNGTYLGSLNGILILVIILYRFLPLPEGNLSSHFPDGEHIVCLCEAVQSNDDRSAIFLRGNAVAVTV
jgi:hypothetical protein